MRKINKRYFRSMRTNRSFHLVVILLTVLIGTLIIAAISTASLMGQVYRQGIRDCNTEDAQFMTMFPIPEDRIGHLEERYAVKLESMTYYDEEAGDYVLRLAAENTAVNTCQVTAGNAPAGDGEVMLSERFADAQGLHIGDSVQIGGKQFTVSGFMVRTDYLCMLRALTDTFPDYNSFGLAVGTSAAVEAMPDIHSYYAVRFDRDNSLEFRKGVNEEFRILSYTAAASNMRIQSALNQSELVMSVAVIIAPVLYGIVLLLIVLMLSRKLKAEQKQVGTLIALGYRPREIRRHYALYSLVPGVIGSVLGLICGYAATFPFSQMYFNFFEALPHTVTVKPLLAVLALVLPPLLYVCAGDLTVRRMLRKDPVQMLRQTDAGKASSGVLADKRMPFRRKYRIRSVLGHKARSAVIIIGVAVSTLCILMGWITKDSADDIVDSSVDQIPYNYSYLLNTTEFQLPEGAEAALVSRYERDGSTLLFSLWGYQEDTAYFKMQTLKGEPMAYGSYYMTNAAAESYGVQPGDNFTFRDLITTEEHTIQIAGILDDNINSAVYTSTANAAEIMGYDAADRNTIVSNDKLELDADMVLSETSREDYRESVKSAVQVYYKMCYIVLFVGFMLGVLSMYLISGMIVEENTVNISMLKILGYRKREIRNLVLTGNHLLLCIGFVVGIPLALAVCGSVCASSAETTGMLISLYVKPVSYVVTLLIVLASYLLSLVLAGRKVERIEMTESLKRNNE